MRKSLIAASRQAYSIFFVFVLLISILTASQIRAEVLGPGWFMGTAEPVSPEAATAYFNSKQGRTGVQGTVGVMGVASFATSATVISDEIKELARGLQYDPKLIYDYVHNHIDYVPYFGSLKGATLTYLDGSGNDFDQASLMIALLTESKTYNAGIGAIQYVYGTMTIPNYYASGNYDLQHWLSVSANSSVISQALSSGGIPSTVYYWDTNMDRVWVKATINGTEYMFDPAFKKYGDTTGIDVKSAMLYDRTALLTAAGGETGTDYIRNLNDSALRSKLVEYSTNLTSFLRTNYPNSEMSEILGDRKIVTEITEQYPAGLRFPYIAYNYWDEVPDAFVHKIHVQHGGIDRMFSIPEIAGKKLAITYKIDPGNLNVSNSITQPPLYTNKFTIPPSTVLPAQENPPVFVTSANCVPIDDLSSLINMGAITNESNSCTEWKRTLSNPSGSLALMRVDSSLSMGSAYSCTNCGSHLLNIGQSVEIVVTFSGAGQSRGTKTAQLHIEHCTECIHTVIQEDYAFTGMIIEYPNLIGSYGASMQTFLNEPVTSFARIINNGSQNLTITDMSLTGNDPSLFQFGLESNTVPGGGYVDIPLQYLASAQGAHSAQIHVTYTYEGINYQYDLPLQGQTRLRPDVSGSSINFGIRYYNQSTNAAAQLVNNGALDLTINSITLTGANPGQFQISWNTGTLPSGQTRNIDVTYMANAVGSHSASIDVAFTYDGLSYSIQLPLSGETIPVPAAQLWLDDVLIDEESQPVSWVDNNTLRPALTLNIDHPYAAPCVPGGPPGCYADQPSTYILKRGASYAIISDFGGSKDGLLLKKRQKILNDYRAIDGLQDMSREVRTEALNIVGQTWMHQTTMSDNLLSQLANVIHVRHHRFGIMAQEKGYYVDVKTQMYSYTSRNNTADDEYKCFKSGGFLNSAMEHGVLEQLQGIDRPAASTIKLITIANTNGSKIFFANGSDFPAIRPQLSGYNEEDLNDIAVRVKPIAEGGDGAVYILPANGLIPLGQWQGKGYVKFTSSEIGMIIGGDYYGGYAGYEGDLEVDPVYNEYFPDLLPPAEISNPVSMEPVDMATGAYTFEHEDLSLGAAEPMGLHFRRYYNSDNNTQESSLGYGWSHSYDIYLNVHSDVKSGLAMRQPIDAAALLVSSIVTLDLMSMSQEQPGIKEWMTAVLTNKWAMDQLFENSVSVHLQNKVLNYIKLPDGISYNPPPGETTQLVKENGLYRIEERFGTKIYLDSNNRISQLTDVDGNAMTFTYDSSGLKTARDAFGRMLTLQYSGDKITSVSDSAGRTVNYSYGADNLTAYSDPEGNGWGYGYEDSNNPHRMTKLTNPMIVNTAINTYDSLGRVKTQSVPRQGSNNTRVNYNFYFSRFKNMEENPDGNTIGYYFDDKGRQIARENELGHKSTTEYDGQNHVIRYTDPKSKVTQFLYDDSSHNLKKITNALNEETKYSYDSLFRLRDTVAPLFNGAHIEYDAEHHPVLAKFGVRYDATLSPVDSGIFQTSASYYANGQTETTSDGRGAVTTLTYDDYGNPNTIRVGSHRFVNYTYYYEIGKIGYLTDQVGSITSFDYDKRGLLESKTDPMGKTTSFTYWSTGNPFSRTDRNNHTIYYSYSLTDKLESITYPDFSTVRLTYNQHDDLSGVQDSVGNISYIYDAAHRLISMTNPYNSAVSYAYDANGNLTELTYPGNKKVVYTYDALNRLNSVMLDWVTPKQTANYYYDAAGRLDYAVNFNGTIMDYDYDNANRLTTLVNKKSDAATLASYSFTLDGNGNRTQIVQDEPLTLSPATDASYAYNAKKNRLLTAGAFSFGYDDEGQLQTGYSSTYSFDYEHRLTGIGSNIQFSYDLVGNRLQAERNGVTTRYIYDAGGNLLAEADGSNNITRYYIHGLGLLAMVTPGNQTYCYHFNAVGSTIAMTDLSQSLVNKYAYDAFGTVTSYAENIPQPFKFVGQFGVMTEPNGFYYMRARYYDPNVGRFISEDPIGFEGGDINLYAYVGNQPVNYNDPNGQFCPWCAVVGGVTGAIGGYTAGTISGDGSTIAALGGGLVGGLAGAIVGLSGVGTFGGGAIGEAAGSIVGGFIGGGVGSIASRQIDNKEFSLSATGVGALAGGLSATIASPVVWGAAALGASEFATSLAGGTMGIMGDTLIGTGAAIHNSWK